MTSNVTRPLPATALIPLRGAGKSRLGAAIDRRSRGRLVAAMLDDVLAALRQADVVDVHVLAGDPEALALAAQRSLDALPDPEHEVGADGDARLRAAVDAGLLRMPADRARLVVAADIPRLDAAEVRAVLDDPADVAIAPTVGGGTGLLRLSPGVRIPSRYGPGSAGAHARVAREHGFSSSMLDLAGARHDVDAAHDLDALAHPLLGAAPGRATAAFAGRGDG